MNKGTQIEDIIEMIGLKKDEPNMDDVIEEQKAVKFEIEWKCDEPGCKKDHKMKFTAYDFIKAISTVDNMCQDIIRDQIMRAEEAGAKHSVDGTMAMMMGAMRYITQVNERLSSQFDTINPKITEIWEKGDKIYNERADALKLKNEPGLPQAQA